MISAILRQVIPHFRPFPHSIVNPSAQTGEHRKEEKQHTLYDGLNELFIRRGMGNSDRTVNGG